MDILISILPNNSEHFESKFVIMIKRYFFALMKGLIIMSTYKNIVTQFAP